VHTSFNISQKHYLQANALIISKPYKVYHDDVPTRPAAKKPTGGPKIKVEPQEKRAATDEDINRRASKRRLVVDDSDDEEVQIPQFNISPPKPTARSTPKIRRSNRYLT
jgi:hypothetical protein